MEEPSLSQVALPLVSMIVFQHHQGNTTRFYTFEVSTPLTGVAEGGSSYTFSILCTFFFSLFVPFFLFSILKCIPFPSQLPFRFSYFHSIRFNIPYKNLYLFQTMYFFFLILLQMFNSLNYVYTFSKPCTFFLIFNPNVLIFYIMFIPFPSHVLFFS